MNIEVVGTSTRNKGAELMLVAIKQHYAAYDGRVQLAVTPWFGSYADRAKYGLLQKVDPLRWGRGRLGMSILPSSFKRSYGLVEESDIKAVIDASGFAFGDQHPVERSRRFASDVERWKKQGKQIVLLPQAFGPFEKPAIRDAFRRILDQVDLVYARDTASFEHIRSVGTDKDKLLLAPDITLGVRVDRASESSQEGTSTVYVVPNSRMLDKTSKKEAGAYIPFLERCIEATGRQGLTPKLLLHDTAEDHVIADELVRQAGTGIDVVREPDPVRLKSILGNARLVIGSRFHALVGALSQAIPTLAVGWSHKYDTLMNDFGCPDMVLSPNDNEERIEELIQVAIRDHDTLVLNLQRAGDRMRDQLEGMWRTVDSVVLTD